MNLRLNNPPPVKIDRMSDARELEDIIKTREALQPNILQRAYRAILALVTTFTDYLDISKYQLPTLINYSEVEAGGIPVIWLRTSDGKYIDPEFDAHWQNCLAEGISVAVYHFFRSNLTGEEQAALIWAIIQPLIEALGYVPRIWLDVESTDLTGNNTRILRLKACIDSLNTYILERTGQVERVGIYSSPGFANVSLIPTPAWLKVTTIGARIFQWIANYTSAALPMQPTGWPVVNRIGWQKGIAGTHEWIPYPVPGFGDMKVDYDYAFMGEAEFIAFNGGVPIPPPDPVPPGEETVRIMKCLKPDLSIRVGASQSSSKIGSLKLNNTYLYLPDRTVTNGDDDIWWAIPNPVPGHLLGYAAKEHPTLSGPGLEDVGVYP